MNEKHPVSKDDRWFIAEQLNSEEAARVAIVLVLYIQLHVMLDYRRNGRGPNKAALERENAAIVTHHVPSKLQHH